MKIRIGPPVTGDNFYERPALIESLLRALRRGNVAFLGPRRTGKTSCLEKIAANPREYLPILLNLEKHDTVEAWLSDMLAELRAALDCPQPRISWVRGKVAEFLGRIRKIDVPNFGGIEISARRQHPPWRKAADEFLALLKGTEIPALFLLDEFPTFLKLVAKKSSATEVEAVLNWFRAARHTLKDSPARFLVTGSIGLKGVVHSLGLAPTVNEFDTHEIPPLSDPEALGLLEVLARNENVKLSDSGRRYILVLLGANWPILLQLFISEIQDAGFTQAPAKKQLEEIYWKRLVGGSRNQYCDGMYDRIKNIFSPSETRLARALLKEAWRLPGGLKRDDLEAVHARLVPNPGLRLLEAEMLDDVLHTLKHDGYLLQATGEGHLTRFASNILRDYWQRKTM